MLVAQLTCIYYLNKIEIKIMIIIINNKSVSKTKTNKQIKIFESDNFYLYSKDVLERLERVL